MASSSDVPVVVMDNGSSLFRAGYPSEAAPRVLIPSLVGQPRNKGVAMAGGFREYEVGYGAQQKRGALDCSQPVRGGVVQDWGDMERLWSHTIYKELRIAPENYCFVISEPTNSSDSDKEKTLEMMMETFNAKSMYLGSTAVLALYAYGLTTGVVVDCGLDKSNAVPIHEGYPLSRHMASSEVAGDALTTHLSKLLNAKGYGFSTQTERELVNKVKETLCYVRSDPGEETVTGDGFYLPDGQYIPLEGERHQCAEALFDFSVLGPEYVPKTKVFGDNGEEFVPSFAKGISWLAYSAVNNSEAALRGQLYNNIVLAGGTTLMPGMRERMQREVTQLYREMHPGEGLIPISISDMPSRQHASWLGGCMLSLIAMFPYLTVTREEYQENGAGIVHCKSL